MFLTQSQTARQRPGFPLQQFRNLPAEIMQRSTETAPFGGPKKGNEEALNTSYPVTPEGNTELEPFLCGVQPMFGKPTSTGATGQLGSMGNTLPNGWWDVKSHVHCVHKRVQPIKMNAHGTWNNGRLSQIVASVSSCFPSKGCSRNEGPSLLVSVCLI